MPGQEHPARRGARRDAQQRAVDRNIYKLSRAAGIANPPGLPPRKGRRHTVPLYFGAGAFGGTGATHFGGSSATHFGGTGGYTP